MSLNQTMTGPDPTPPPPPYDVAKAYADHVWEETLYLEKLLFYGFLKTKIRLRVVVKWSQLNAAQRSEFQAWYSKATNDEKEWVKKQDVSSYSVCRRSKN